MAKIAFIGAGSTVFARALIGDVLLHPELRDTTFALMDFDANRLVNVQGLVVEAALTGRREPVYHAAMLDPHAAEELSLDEIAHLVEELLGAHGHGITPLEAAS